MPVIRFFVNLVEKQNRNKTKKRSVKKLIAWGWAFILSGGYLEYGFASCLDCRFLWCSDNLYPVLLKKMEAMKK